MIRVPQWCEQSGAQRRGGCMPERTRPMALPAIQRQSRATSAVLPSRTWWCRVSSGRCCSHASVPLGALHFTPCSMTSSTRRANLSQSCLLIGSGGAESCITATVLRTARGRLWAAALYACAAEARTMSVAAGQNGSGCISVRASCGSASLLLDSLTIRSNRLNTAWWWCAAWRRRL